MLLNFYMVILGVFAVPHPKTFQSIETGFESGISLKSWNEEIHSPDNHLEKLAKSISNLFIHSKEPKGNMPRVVSDMDLSSGSLRSQVSRTDSTSGHSELKSLHILKKPVFQHISDLKYDPKVEIVVGREIWTKRDDGAIIKYIPQHIQFHENYMNIWAGETITLKNGNPGAKYSVIITVFKKDGLIDDQPRKMYKELKDHYKIWYGIKESADWAKLNQNLKSINHQPSGKKARKFHLPQDHLIYFNDEDMILIGPKSVYLNFHT